LPSLLAASSPKRQCIFGHIVSAYSRSGLDFAEVLDAAAFPEAIAVIVKHNQFLLLAVYLKNVFGYGKSPLRTS
jgi:hypothetical protein